MVDNDTHKRKLLSDRRKWQKRLKPASAVVLIASLFLEANYDLVNRLSAKVLLNLDRNAKPYHDCTPQGTISRVDGQQGN